MTGLHVSARTNVSMAQIPMIRATITGTKSVVKRKEAWRNRLLWLAMVVDSRMFQPICPGFETRFRNPIFNALSRLTILGSPHRIMVATLS